jgi:hypothetical protein
MKVFIADLVLDYEIYPRQTVDATHVSHLCQAIASGTEIPPIIICKKTNRVIDGFHRIMAIKKLYGEDADVEVVKKQYKNEAHTLLDAIKYNADHGRKLDRCDRIRCVHLAKQMKLSVSAIGEVLHMKREALEALVVDRTAFNTKAGLTIALKPSVSHLRGKKLTHEQIEANKKIGGNQALFYVHQLQLILNTPNFLDEDNEPLVTELRNLGSLIEKTLGEEVTSKD